MKPRCSERRNQALTLVEVLVVIFVVGFFALMILPNSNSGSRKPKRLECVNNLKETGLAFKIWAGDHGDKYPMDISVTNGGTMEIFSQRSSFQDQVFLNYLVMSNELNTPRLLYCPADTNGFMATDFVRGFNNQNVSYFVGADAQEANPQMMLSGDDNFEIGGVPVGVGLFQISTNTPIAWSAARHGHAGNVALTDGSVQQLTTSGLRKYSGLATNRFAIP